MTIITNAKIVEILERMIRLLEQGWCQGAAAHDDAGRSVDALDSDAVEFCLTGAIARALIDVGYSIKDVRLWGAVCDRLAQQHLNANHALIARAWLYPDASQLLLIGFNDHKDTTREDVILLAKHALDAAQRPLP